MCPITEARGTVKDRQEIVKNRKKPLVFLGTQLGPVDLFVLFWHPETSILIKIGLG